MRAADKIDRDDGKARKILKASRLQYEYAGRKAYIPKKESGLSKKTGRLKNEFLLFYISRKGFGHLFVRIAHADGAVIGESV